MIIDYHFLLMQCHLSILSIFIHGQKLSIHSYLKLKITFNIRNVLCEGNIFLLWSVGSEIYLECAQHEETTCVLKSFLHFLPCV